MKNGGVEGGSRVKESHKEAGEEPATGKRSRATHKFPLHANCIFNIYILTIDGWATYSFT